MLVGTGCVIVACVLVPQATTSTRATTHPHALSCPLCSCGYVYCSTHRHATEHACTFDYKAMDRERLAKANPTVAAARVQKF